MMDSIVSRYCKLRLGEELLCFVDFAGVQGVLIFGSELSEELFDSRGWWGDISFCKGKVVDAAVAEVVT